MWDDTRQLNFAAAALVLAAVAILGYGLAKWAAARPSFAVRSVVVKGEIARVNPAHLESAIRQGIAGTFFTVDLDAARRALAQVPWVRRAHVRRHWPNGLEVELVEHVPLAWWNDTALVNAHGEVFYADYDGDLPQFAAPQGRAAVVAARYGEMSGELARAGLVIDEIALSARGAWQLRLAGGLTVVLGREHVSERLARFVSVHERTIARIRHPVDVADMRYGNGFVLRMPGFGARGGKG
jgi:cell division protein FtsQ